MSKPWATPQKSFTPKKFLIKDSEHYHHSLIEEGSDIEEEVNFNTSYVHWSSSDGRMFFPAASTVDNLIPGVYEIRENQQTGIFFEKISANIDGLLRFPDTSSDRVIEEIEKFWNREDVFKEYNLTYKRGIILYGPPGSGKTTTIKILMKDVVDRGGIVVKFFNPFIFIAGMRILRQIQPDIPVVVIMEDIDAILEQFNESEVLNILDGFNEVKKMVFLATTNYPEKLGGRIVNRPSRFDKRFRIGYPNAKARRMYFEHLIGRGDKLILESKIKELKIDLSQWIKDTNEMSVAHLKELFIQVVVIGDDYKESIEILQKMKENLTDNEFDNSLGFVSPSKSKNFYN